MISKTNTLNKSLCNKYIVYQIENTFYFGNFLILILPSTQWAAVITCWEDISAPPQTGVFLQFKSECNPTTQGYSLILVLYPLTIDWTIGWKPSDVSCCCLLNLEFGCGKMPHSQLPFFWITLPVCRVWQRDIVIIIKQKTILTFFIVLSCLIFYICSKSVAKLCSTGKIICIINWSCKFSCKFITNT